MLEGRSIPLVRFRWSSLLSSISQRAKLLIVDFTRARWLRLNPPCSYEQWQAQGYPIGSGLVERAVALLINTRMKKRCV